MLTPRFAAPVLLGILLALGIRTASSQIYPNKPIRMVTLQPGGSGDFTTRLVSTGLSAKLGQPVIVDNREPNVIAEVVAKAPPDGYTLLSYGSPVWILPLLRKTSWDPIRDFLPITLAVSSPAILVVNPSVPVNSVQELIALAKAKPGALNYAQGEIGGPNHLAGELFKAIAGLDIVGIPYKGGGPALVDLAGGRVQLMFASAGGLAPYINSGKLKSLAVTTAQPSSLFPGLPTMMASGVPGYETGTRQGMWAPANTPVTLVNRLNREIAEVLRQPDVKTQFAGVGYEIVANSPEEFDALIKSEMVKWDKVIKDAHIHVD